MAGSNTSVAVIEGILEEQGTTEGAPRLRQEIDSIANVSDVVSSPYLQAAYHRVLNRSVPVYFTSCFIISICI
jgi:hypothetical protein